MGHDSDEASSRKLAVAAFASIAFAFLTLRLAYLLVREPFFDELFTLWISARDLRGLFHAITLDSGPPLYYLLTFAASSIASSVTLLRMLSIVLAAIGFVAILKARLPQTVEATALLLVAILPLHVHFSTEARSYAFCGSAIGVAAIALHRWRARSSRRELVVAVLALLVAAYSHYYGVLAFPLIVAAALVPDLWPGRESYRALKEASVATLILAVLYLPGFLLAAAQPAAAHAWMAEAPFPLLSATRQLSIAGATPLAVMPAPPLPLQLAGLAIVAAVLLHGARRRQTWWWATATLLPLLCSSLLVAVGMDAYFPGRFESVLLVPFCIWVAVALNALAPKPRRGAVIAIVVVAVLTLGYAMQIFVSGVEDPYRKSARLTAAAVGDARVIVSGLSYLELVSARGSERDVVALPSEQAQHPGWRAVVPSRQLESESSRIAAANPQIFWLGELGTPELRALAARYEFRQLHRNGRLALLLGRRK